MDEVDYSKAYVEVLDTLKYISIEEYNKIPKKFIMYMEENYDENYDFSYNVAIPFEEQNMSKEAKNILAMIYRLFLASDEKKKELNEMDKLEESTKEKEKLEKDSYDNLFKNKQKVKEESTSMQVVKEKWYTVIFNKIKELFKK